MMKLMILSNVQTLLLSNLVWPWPWWSKFKSKYWVHYWVQSPVYGPV